jgi:hypothetical protein
VDDEPTWKHFLKNKIWGGMGEERKKKKTKKKRGGEKEMKIV